MTDSEALFENGQSRTPLVNLVPAASLTETEMKRVAELIRGHSGIAWQSGDTLSLRFAVARHMHRLGINNPRDYFDLIGSPAGTAELNELVGQIVVQKTSFFRDRAQFELLEKTVLDGILRRSGDQSARINIWSAGCATGQEPYSLAILMRRNVLAANRAKVLGTDIARASLNRATDARFKDADLAGITEAERAFFVKDDDGWRVCESIRSMVEFRFHNLVADPFPVCDQGGWNVIFCRNVLIYFSRDTIREIVNRFHKVLSPQGHLFLGASESLFRLTDGFEATKIGNAFVYQKSGLAKGGTRLHPQPTPKAETHRRPSEQESAPSKTPPPPKTKPRPEPAKDYAAELKDAKRKLEEGRQEQAFQSLFSLTHDHPNAVEPVLLLGQLALDRGAIQEAWSWFLVATEIDPLNVESRFHLAVVLFHLGHDDEATLQLRKLLFLDGSFSLGHYYLGVVTERAGEFETARSAFRNALRTCEDKGNLQMNRLLEKNQLSWKALASAIQARLRQLDQQKNRREG